MKRFVHPVTAAAALFAGGSIAAEFDCLIVARLQLDIGSPLEAVNALVNVRRGGRVKKGQVIATRESGPMRASLELARCWATMRGELNSAEARVELAKDRNAPRRGAPRVSG